MIEIKLNNQTHQLPASWNDVTYTHYCQIITQQIGPYLNRLETYTGIPQATLNSLPLKSVNAIAAIVDFMDTPEDVHAFAQPYQSDINVADETYGKLEQAKQALQNSPHPITGAAEVVKIYTGTDISQQPITTAIGPIAFFLTVLEHSWTATSAWPTTNPPMKSWKQVLSSLTHLAALAPQPH